MMKFKQSLRKLTNLRSGFIAIITLAMIAAFSSAAHYDSKAAGAPISKVSDSIYLDASYNFTISKSAGVSYFGCNNGYTANVSSDSQKGTIGAWFYNVGSYNGTSIDLKMTVVGWDKRLNGSTINVHPTLNNGIQLINVDGVTVRYDFYRSGTGTPITVKGYSCITDVDDQQSFTLVSGIEQAYIASNSILSVSGSKVSSPSITTTNDDTRSWVQLVFNTNSFTVKYTNSPDMYSHFEFSPNPVASIVKIAHKIMNTNANGVITDNITNIKDHESRTITWTPNKGYYVASVKIDGNAQSNINEKGGSYTFSDITSDHKVDVVCKPYHKVTTKVTNGTISPSNSTLKDGANYSTDYAPKEGYYLYSVTVDGKTVSSETFRNGYDFRNIMEDHNIEVVYKIKPTVTVTKRIAVDDIYYDHGNPTFLFNLSGTDFEGNACSYYKSMTFDSDYVKNNAFTENGVRYVEGSVQFTGLMPGSYTAKEQGVSRYTTDTVSGVAGGTAGQGTASFDLVSNENGSANFTNAHTVYRNLSHNSAVINEVHK